MKDTSKNYVILEGYAYPVMTTKELSEHFDDEEVVGATFAVPKAFLEKWAVKEGYRGGADGFLNECTLEDCESLLTSAIENDAFYFCYCPFRAGDKFVFPKAASSDAMAALADFTTNLAYDHLFEKLVASLPKPPRGYEPDGGVQPYTDGHLHVICQNEEHAKLVNTILKSVGAFRPDDFKVTWFLSETLAKEHPDPFKAILEALPDISELLPGYVVGQNNQMYTDGKYIFCQSEEQANIIADMLDVQLKSLNRPETVTGYFNPKEDIRNGTVDKLTGFWYITV